MNYWVQQTILFIYLYIHIYIHKYIDVHACMHKYTHKLTYVPWTEELDRPTTGSGVNHNKENIHRSSVKRSIKLYGISIAYIYSR